MVPDSLDLAERLLEEGDAAQAQALAAEVLDRDPQDPRALHIAGKIEALAGRSEAAVRLLEQAAELAPQRVATYLELAQVYASLRDPEAAQDTLSLALYYDGDNAEAHFQLGSLRRQRGDLDGAIDSFKRALQSDACHVPALAELGFVYLKKENHEEAVRVLEQAVELDPKNFPAQSNLGLAYVKVENYDRGHKVFAALCEKVGRSITLPRINLATSLDHTGRFDEAQRIYNEVLQYEPNNYSARWNRALNLLARGEFAQGWDEYSYRLQEESLGPPRLVPFKPWKGESLRGKRVVVTAEQGLGDQIMFLSCLNEVTAGAEKVLLECDQRLVPLLQRSFPNVEVVGTRYELIPAWLQQAVPADYHVPMGNMPCFVRRTLTDFPQHRGYLRADEAKVRRWKAWLASLGPGLKVGLSWRGGTPTTRRRLRSLALDDLLPVMRTPGCRFVCLQYGDVAADLQRVRMQHGVDIAYDREAIEDYDETAALCVALELTISVCTAVIHLNGALGRPAWVMVPAVAEWRYGRRGERLPWYPSVQLLRQAEGGDWSDVIERIGQELGHLAKHAMP